MKVPPVNLRVCFATAPRCTEIKIQDKKGDSNSSNSSSNEIRKDPACLISAAIL